MTTFTDEELLAYADEQLSSERCASVEQCLRTDAVMLERLTSLLRARDQGDHSVGELWRRFRLSCPPRAVWGAYASGRLGDGLSNYLRFHVEVIGCRACAANLADLQHPDAANDNERRTKKIFQSSAGNLGNQSFGNQSVND
jgi:hypothetical protein